MRPSAMIAHWMIDCVSNRNDCTNIEAMMPEPVKYTRVEYVYSEHVHVVSTDNTQSDMLGKRGVAMWFDFNRPGLVNLLVPVEEIRKMRDDLDRCLVEIE